MGAYPADQVLLAVDGIVVVANGALLARSRNADVVDYLLGSRNDGVGAGELEGKVFAD